jgi:hypothetical protein
VVGKLILYRTEAVRDWLARHEREVPGRDRRRRYGGCVAMAATLTLSHNGLSLGVPGMRNQTPSAAGIVGWSAGHRRRGRPFVPIHWVLEWQRRQVPHLHGCMFFPTGHVLPADQVVNAWCCLAQHGAMSAAQTGKPITDLTDWLKYVAKHAARGVRHYQHSGDAIPSVLTRSHGSDVWPSWRLAPC